MNIFAKILTGSAGLAMVAIAAPAAAQYAPYGGNSAGVGGIISQILGGGRYGAYGQGQDRVAVDQCARAAEARASRDYRPAAYGNYPGYDPRYANQGYNRMTQARVVGITAVERRSNGVKVSGVIDSGRNPYRGAYAGQGYGNPNQAYAGQGYAYPNQAYAGQGYAYPNQAYPNQAYPNPGYGNAYAYGQQAQVADLRFSCRVDFRGYVSSVDIKRNVAARRGY